jgi:hypothetical protein
MNKNLLLLILFVIISVKSIKLNRRNNRHKYCNKKKQNTFENEHINVVDEADTEHLLMVRNVYVMR